jgi:multicomponent K+:H+ antiporter subunit G
MDMTSLAEIAVSLLLVVGAFFLVVGSLGLAKLPDLMRRLHGPTKATTLGVGATLIGAMLWSSLAGGGLAVKELLVAVFLFLTAPVTGQMIAKAHMLRDRAVRRTLPPTGGEAGWATLDPARDRAGEG